MKKGALPERGTLLFRDRLMKPDSKFFRLPA